MKVKNEVTERHIDNIVTWRITTKMMHLSFHLRNFLWLPAIVLLLRKWRRLSSNYSNFMCIFLKLKLGTEKYIIWSECFFHNGGQVRHWTFDPIWNLSYINSYWTVLLELDHFIWHLSGWLCCPVECRVQFSIHHVWRHSHCDPSWNSHVWNREITVGAYLCNCVHNLRAFISLCF